MTSPAWTGTVVYLPSTDIIRTCDPFVAVPKSRVSSKTRPILFLSGRGASRTLGDLDLSEAHDCIGLLKVRVLHADGDGFPNSIECLVDGLPVTTAAFELGT